MAERCACGYAPDWCYRNSPDTTKYCHSQKRKTMIPLFPDRCSPSIVKEANKRNAQDDFNFDDPDEFDFG